jgi:hypothetical protein
MTTFKIGAAMMVRNASLFIGAVVQALSWVDCLYIYDDNSSDGTRQLARANAHMPLHLEQSENSLPAFAHGERESRNYVLERAFEMCNCDALVLVDSDEMLSAALRPLIVETFRDPKLDSVCFSTWHIYDDMSYIHFWETHMNGVYLIDPHIRVIRRGKYFEAGSPDGSHPFIRTTDFTRCIHGPYHYHLKYHSRSPYPNYALNFLPKRPTRSDVAPYLRKLPEPIPADIRKALSQVQWDSFGPLETDYYTSYEGRRQILSPDQALVHPRDLK